MRNKRTSERKYFLVAAFKFIFIQTYGLQRCGAAAFWTVWFCD